jgi:hypothetical protein
LRSRPEPAALTHVGFRLGALETLCQMGVGHGPGDHEISGYLAEVPVLEQPAPAVQADLLADAWRRRHAPELHEAEGDVVRLPMEG